MSGDGETGGELDREALIEYLRATFAQTPLHRLLDIRMLTTDEPGTVVVEMPVRPEAFNGSGNLHGGAIATLVDVAAGSCAARASNFEPGRNTLVTADLHVRYLGRPKGRVVRAEARVMRAGRQLIVVECRIADELGNVIAFADFAGMIVPLRHPLQPARESADLHVPDL